MPLLSNLPLVTTTTPPAPVKQGLSQGLHRVLIALDSFLAIKQLLAPVDDRLNGGQRGHLELGHQELQRWYRRNEMTKKTANIATDQTTACHSQ